MTNKQIDKLAKHKAKIANEYQQSVIDSLETYIDIIKNSDKSFAERDYSLELLLDELNDYFGNN